MKTRTARTALITALLAAAGAVSPTYAASAAEKDDRGRRVADGLTTLAFDGVSVEELIPFVVEATGKIVIPQDLVTSRKITIINDAPIPMRDAVDYLFMALTQAGVAVIETEDQIIFRDINDMKQQDVPVIGPDESVLKRKDLGTFATKVFALRFTTAESMEDVLEDFIPDYGALAVDPESNQVVVRGPLSLLRKIELMLVGIDRESAASLQTQTFKLRYADAEQIAENITELFESEGTSAAQQQQFQRFFGRGGGNQEDANRASTSENLRVSANTQQNTVSVLAEPSVLRQIAEQIEKFWDVPLEDNAVIPRVYDLVNSDPVKIAAALEGLFGETTTTTGGQGQGQAPSTGTGAGRLAGQFTFQALPEAGRIMVIAKSPDNLAVIDEIVAQLDQPQTVGLPEIVPLKHANAEELAEQLNTLLALEGTVARLPRQEEGLTEGAANISPFASDDSGGTDDGGNEDLDLITFWWQSARPPTDSSAASNLVGTLRLVPVWRQNAVMILSPPEYRAGVLELIDRLDQPGRQVLISAIIAEVERDDSLALGLRWGSGAIESANPDNAISIGTTTTGTENDFLGNLFDTSVLNLNTDLNAIFQALDQKGDVNILSEPRIFTSDNQEAVFFDGQDIPIVDTVQFTDNGSRNTTRTYRAVGIQLRARPRITQTGNVDIRVNLQLSSISPGQVSDDFVIIDRRETTTQLIVQDGQTVVISGILRSEDSDVTRKIPFFGDLPLIGALFTSTEQSTRQTELVAFITPIVVENSQDLNRVNEPYRERLKILQEQLLPENRLRNTEDPDADSPVDPLLDEDEG